MYSTSKKIKVVLKEPSSAVLAPSVFSSVSGLLKSVAGAIVSAIPGTDYATPQLVSCDDILDGTSKHLVSDVDLESIRANTGDETKQSIQSKLGIVTENNSGYLAATDYSEFKNKVSKKQSIAYAICLRR